MSTRDAQRRAQAAYETKRREAGDVRIVVWVPAAVRAAAGDIIQRRGGSLSDAVSEALADWVNTNS